MKKTLLVYLCAGCLFAGSAEAVMHSFKPIKAPQESFALQKRSGVKAIAVPRAPSTEFRALPGQQRFFTLNSGAPVRPKRRVLEVDDEPIEEFMMQPK